MANKETVLLARCVYRRMLEDFPSAKDCLNTELLMELIDKQGCKDPRTRHKLDFTRARVFQRNTHSPLVWSNAEIRNGGVEV